MPVFIENLLYLIDLEFYLFADVKNLHYAF